MGRLSSWYYSDGFECFHVPLLHGMGRAGLSAPFSPGTVDRIGFLPVLSAPKIECNGYIWQHLSDSEQTGVFSVQVSTWLSTNQIPFTAAGAGFRIPLLGAKKSAKPL